MTSVPVYITPDGRSVPIPPELAAKTKFTKAGLPDRRLKANAEFNEWADKLDSEWAGKAHVEVIKASLSGPAVSPAQAYALRVWNGQSIDVPRNERIERVKRALEGQNLPFEGVELP